MGESYLKKTLLKDVLHDTFPVLTGYVVLGAGFGIIMTSNGYGILFSVLMSVFIFAGSMQYAAIGLFTGSASFLTVALYAFISACVCVINKKTVSFII